MKLSVNEISKKKVLHEISFSIVDGDRIALIGPNGSGKTTILNIIMYLMSPSSGYVTKENIKMSAVFQNNILDNDLTVYQNIFCRIKDPVAISYMMEKMKLLRIDSHLQYSKLSGGQKRIVNFLRAIAANPNCLILDELTAGIDLETRQIIWRNINDYLDNHSENCILYTTHLLDELNNANKIIFISSGTIRYIGNVENFMKSTPKVKLTFNNNVKYFNTSNDAIKFTIDHKVSDEYFEIKKVNYSDLLENWERKI